MITYDNKKTCSTSKWLFALTCQLITTKCNLFNINLLRSTSSSMAASHHEAAAEDMKKLRESYTNLATNHQHLKKDHQKLIGELQRPFKVI